jgi:thymidylate synthase
MRQYLDLLEKVLKQGVESENRTGTNTLSLFGEKMEFNLEEGFPLLTTKMLSFKNILTELIWFTKGTESAEYLNINGNTIWKEWEKNGMLYETYGKQWRSFGDPDSELRVDQLARVIEQIKVNPTSRRLVISAWNPMTVEQASLPPCHVMFQFSVSEGKLSCCLFQRSCDIFLGVPYNIASYSLLTHIIAKLCGLKVGKFVWFGGNVHLYANHIDTAKEQLGRQVGLYALPLITVDDSLQSIDELEIKHVSLIGYQAYPTIKAKVAV